MNWSRTFFLLFIAGALYFASLNVDAPLLYLLTSLLISFLLVTWLGSFRNVKKIQCKRNLSLNQIHENQSILIAYTIENLSRFSKYALRMEDVISLQKKDSGKDSSSGWLTFLAHRSGRDIELHYRFPHRGLYRLGPLTITSDYPFGLLTRKKIFKSFQEIRVYPEIIYIRDFPVLHKYDEFQSLGTQLYVGQGDEFYGIREYRHGDPLRNVHWKGTARHREIMVREVQRISEPEISICMDENVNTQNGIGKESSYEYAVKIAATISHHANFCGYRLQYFDQHNYVFDSIHEIMRYLSECQPDSASILSNRLWNIAHSLKPHSTFIVTCNGYQQDILSPLQFIANNHIHLILIWIRSDSFDKLPFIPDKKEMNVYYHNLKTITPYIYEFRKGDSIQRILENHLDKPYADARI